MTKEEAIEIVKKNYPHVSFSGSEFENALRELIPELKNSEDERIRQMIERTLREAVLSEHISETSYREMWAYLKKQKEPHYSPLCKTIKDKIREYIANYFIADMVVKTDVRSIVKAMEEGVRLGKEEQKSTERSEREEHLMKALRITNARIAELIEENYNLKETKQKWSEEDENRFNNLCSVIDENESWNNVSKQAFKDWIKSIRSQTKPEWNEEDESMLENILGTYKTLEDMLNLSTGQDRDILESMNFERDWLKNKFKSLRPQPKQERHLGMRDQWCCSAAWAAVRDSDAYNGEEKQSILDFLQKCESQPHWKPSKEQMEALADATMRDVFPKGNRECLESLYNDLKSL